MLRLNCFRWILGISLAVLIVAVPVLYQRYRYQYSKRLHEVTAGRVYRSGAMLADGFRDVFERCKIRTVINLQNEAPDPEVRLGFLTGATIRESELCRQHNVRFVFLNPDLISRRLVPQQRPKVIDEFLELMDDPATYPVLIHCRAGLHRTGILTAVYRMEYDHWPVDRAMRELKVRGFGDRKATCANDYILQYVLSYRPGIRRSILPSPPGGEGPGVRGRAATDVLPDPYDPSIFNRGISRLGNGD